jgi:hypothetical protein
MTSTQQSEALQAVRLLHNAASDERSKEHTNPEMLFRARVLLEGFIKSAGVLESIQGEPKKIGLELSAFIDGTRWHFGDTVILRSGIVGVITGINSQEKRFKVLTAGQDKVVNAHITNVTKVESDE